MRGQKYRSRKEFLDQAVSEENQQVYVNSTTMAQWLRHCSPETIEAQMLKLQGLKIDKLHIDYKIIDRTNDERPYLESEDENLQELNNSNRQDMEVEDKERKIDEKFSS